MDEGGSHHYQPEPAGEDFAQFNLEMPEGYFTEWPEKAIRQAIFSIATEAFWLADHLLFGPDKVLHERIRKGGKGGGPMAWVPLSEAYLAYKQRMMERGQNYLSLKKGLKGSRGTKRKHILAAIARFEEGGISEMGQVPHFQIGTKLIKSKKTGKGRAGAKIYNEPPPWEIISDKVWVRTGKILNEVVLVEAVKMVNGKPKFVKDGKRRKVRIRRKGDEISYKIEIDEGLSYWKYADHEGKPARPLFRWEPSVIKAVEKYLADKVSEMLEGKWMGEEQLNYEI